MGYVFILVNVEDGTGKFSNEQEIVLFGLLHVCLVLYFWTPYFRCYIIELLLLNRISI